MQQTMNWNLLCQRWTTISLAAIALSGCAQAVTFDPPAERKTYNSRHSGREPLPERVVGPSEYMVRSGDTLYSIAFRRQLDYRELARLNNIGADYRIYPGQVLALSRSVPQRALVTDQIVSKPVDIDQPPVRPVPVIPGSSPALVTLPTASQQPLPDRGSYQWQWPTQGVVVRGYAPEQGSKGLDFTGEVGQPVVAAAPGRVVYSGSALKGYGELVIIKHDDLHLSAYGYNRKRLVNEGDVVAAGQPIAELGVGPESKPVLHFEIRERGKPVNPVSFLPAKSG